MGLQEQHVAFKFAGGVETKMDSKAVPAVKLLALENGVFTRAISIKKRNGYEALSRAIDGSASLVTDARRLAARDNEMLALTGTRCYSKHSTLDVWGDAGAVIGTTGYERPVVATSSQQLCPDHASAGGVTVYAWEDSRGGVWWTLEDTATGAIRRAPAAASPNGQRPRCIQVGEALHVYYAVPTAHAVYVLVINPATPSADVTPIILVEDLHSSNPVYDAVPTQRPGNPGLIAWQEYGTTNIRVGYVTQGGVLGSPASGHPSVARFETKLDFATPPLAVGYRYIDGDNGDRIFVGYGTPDGEGALLLANGGAVLTPIAEYNSLVLIGASGPRCTVVVDDTYCWLILERDAAQPTQYSIRAAALRLADETAAGTEQVLLSVALASRGFAAGGEAYAMFVHDSTYFNTYYTLRITDFAPAGRHVIASATGRSSRSHLPSAHVIGSVVTTVVPYKTRLESLNNDKFTESALTAVVIDFDDPNSRQTAQLGRGLTMAGACPMHYDGRIWTEQGFHMGPEYITSVLGAGGAMTVSSTYGYTVWYEWTDAQGEIHRGPTSVNTVVVTGGAQTKATFQIPTLRLTRKSNVRLCVARTIPGDTAKYYRVSSLDPTTAGNPNGYLANDVDVDALTFVDTMSDATLILQEPMYTIDGILSNDPAPVGSHVIAGKNRLFFTDAQSGSIVRFSKRIQAGYAAELAPEFAHDIDPLGGDITALATMDDVVYAFKATAIHAFNGDGPYENGASSNGTLIAGFSSSQLVMSDIGCTDPSSIVLTPQGLMFKSAKGIYVITRGREVVYLGSPVEAYNTQEIRRSVVMPDRTAILFLTDSGKTLYYDYQFQQWSTFTNHEGYDAIVVDGVFHYLRSDSAVWRETIDQHSDAGDRIILRFETAWLHLLEHLQGFQRFWKLLLLGTWSSPHQLGIQHRTSYDEAWSDPYYLDATNDTSEEGWITGDNANPIGEDPIAGTVYGADDYGYGPYGGTGPDVYWWRYGIHEDGASVQFRFEDFEKAGQNGASFELTEMTITGGVKKVDMRPFGAARST